MAENIILETRSISKSFGKVRANHNISISLKEGEIVSILGENGAGKSTLMNILYGLYQPNEGQVELKGQPVRFASPREAIALGLGMVHQHFMLVETLTVTQNIILGEEPVGRAGIDYKKARQDILELSRRYHLEIDPDRLISDLTVGLQQRVEILKALYRKAKILILDEPTAVLTPQEVKDFFKVVRRLREQGVSVIIITHKLEEIREISERVYILRKGEITGEFPTEGVSAAELAHLMVGRDVVLKVDKTSHDALEEPLFEIQDLHVRSNRKLPALQGLSLSVRPGEIVGIAGVDGNGQEELAEAVMGLRKIEGGKLLLKDRLINGWTVRDRIANGMGYVPADRQKDGLVLPFSIAENILLGNQRKPELVQYGHVKRRAIREQAAGLIRQFDILAEGPDVPVGNLSGGNQQKVILAREFDRGPDFMLISQPTRGLDVGAIEYIHKQLIRMRDRNVGLLLISLELEEIFSLADRILILFEGRIIKELSRADATETQVGFYMTGGEKGDSLYE